MRHQSQLPHSCVWEQFIYSQDRVHIFFCSRTGRPIVVIYNRSQTHECGNWDWGRAIPFLGILVSNFLYCVIAVYLMLTNSPRMVMGQATITRAVTKCSHCIIITDSKLIHFFIFTGWRDFVWLTLTKSSLKITWFEPYIKLNKDIFHLNKNKWDNRFLGMNAGQLVSIPKN